MHSLLDSQLSCYSQNSSKDCNSEETSTAVISPTVAAVAKINSPTHLNNLTEFNRSTLKRKLLESTSPQKNKMHITDLSLKENLSDEDNRVEQEEDANVIDLRIAYYNKKDKKN